MYPDLRQEYDGGGEAWNTWIQTVNQNIYLMRILNYEKRLPEDKKKWKQNRKGLRPLSLYGDTNELNLCNYSPISIINIV